MRVQPDHRLLLRAVLLGDDRARGAWTQWRAIVDVDAVDGPSQRLLPLLARRLPEVAPDDRVRALVRGIYRHTWVRNHVLWRYAVTVLDSLREHEVPAILLKGAALVPAYGGDWGARPMFDIDVLVPHRRAGDAIDVLSALGWAPEDNQSAEWVRWRALARHHSWGFTSGAGRLDLHWHVLSNSVGAHADDEFWSGARRLSLDGYDALVLDPADLLFHLLMHGTRTTNAPPIQWVADAVMVMRAFGGPELHERLAVTARRHGELAAASDALDAIGALVDPAIVAPSLERLRRKRRSIVERARRAGERRDRPREPIRQLARHAAGGTGLARGVAGLVRDRLDLDLSTHPIATLLYAGTLRPHHVARVWRRLAGSFVRTPVTERPPIAAGVTIEFTNPIELDRYGALGWGRVQATGAATRGAEPRLVLPLATDLVDTDLVATIELEARDGVIPVNVFANETLTASASIPTNGTQLRFTIPATVAQRFSPLELTFRNSTQRFLRPPSSLRLRIRRLQLDTATGEH